MRQSNWIQESEDSVLINKSKSIIVNESTERRMNSSPIEKSDNDDDESQVLFSNLDMTVSRIA